MRTNFYESCKKTFRRPLVTERLIIRPWRKKEAAQIAAFFNAESRAFIKYWNITQSRFPSDITGHYVRNDLLGDMKWHWTARPCFDFALYHRQTGKMIGNLNFYNDTKGRSRLSYFILPSERKSGYAKEAYRAWLKCAGTKKMVSSVFAETAQNNKPSVALLRSLGFTETGRGTSESAYFKGKPVVRFNLRLES